MTSYDPQPLTAAVPTNEFDRRLSLYNWKPTNTAKLRAALARARSGGRGVLAFVGDSITAGVNNSETWDLITSQDPFPVRVTNALQSRGYPIAGDGPVYARNASVTAAFTDDRWTLNPAQFGATGLNLAYSTTTNGAAATFVSTRPGTIVEIWYYNNSTGPFTYNIDGAGAVLVTPIAGTTIGKVQVTGLADTTHTVVLTTTTTATTFVLAVAVRRASGLTVVNAGLAGSTALSWAVSTYTTPPGQVLLVEAPDATFIMLETNDFAAYTDDEFRTNITATAINFRAVGDVVLLVTPPLRDGVSPIFDKKPVRDGVLYQIADDLDLPLVDFQHHFGNRNTFEAQGYNSVDVTHPNRAAHTSMGELLATIVS